MNKKVDMIAFKGKDFDCQKSLTKFVDQISGDIGPYDPDYGSHYSCDTWQRPRPNKAQDLDGWSWVPDGLVWFGQEHTEYYRTVFSGMKYTSKQVREVSDNGRYFLNLKCIGVEPEYSLWGEERGMEVIEL